MMSGYCVLFFRFFLILGSFALSKAHALQIPRFVCTRSHLVNMHVGPGKKYPITLQLICAGIPLEVIAEFDCWRQVRGPCGEIGWIHKALLSSKRMVYIKENRTLLYQNIDRDSPVNAYLQKGVIGYIKKIKNNYCYILIKHKNFSHYKGWVRKSDVFGMHDHENVS